MTNTKPHRVFLPWDQPQLQSAASWLLDQVSGFGGDDAALDLSGRIVVVPTAGAGRRLRRQLAAEALERGATGVLAPKVVTPAALIDPLDGALATSVATPAEMFLAWIAVADTAFDDRDGQILTPADSDKAAAGFPWAMRRASEFTQLRATLGEYGLDFAAVRDRVAGDDVPLPFGEVKRWRALARLEERYLSKLAQHGRSDRHAARMAWAAKPQLPAGINAIDLVMVSDPIPLAIAVLEQLASQAAINVLVNAAPEHSDDDHFDSWGRPQRETWCTAPLSIDRWQTRIHVAADQAGQADLVAGIAKTAQENGGGKTAFGITDPSLAAPISSALAAHGIPARDPAGKPLQHHRVGVFLNTLSRFVTTGDFKVALELARCPDVLAWLGSLALRDQPDADPPIAFQPHRLFAQLDKTQRDRIPSDWDAGRKALYPLTQVPEDPKYDDPPRRIAIAAFTKGLSILLKPFHDPETEFPHAVEKALSSVYAKIDRHDPSSKAAALEHVLAALQEMRSPLSGAAAPGLADRFALLSHQLDESRLYTRGEEGSKEPLPTDLDGWLELPWEDAPHLIVAGCNEGSLPESQHAHAWLPDGLRTELGLNDNTQRLARDAYLLASIAAPRRASGRLDLVLGQTDAHASPARPSQLFFLCDPGDLPERVERLFRPAPQVGSTGVFWQAPWKLAVPEQKVTRVSVTALADYLASPFRFYLKEGLRMDPEENGLDELGHLGFGSFVHNVLEDYGKNDQMRALSKESEIAAAFDSVLDARVKRHFGENPAGAVLVQAKIARRRLREAARVQSAVRSQGWEIASTEFKIEWPMDQGITLVGKIDRIDRREVNGTTEWRVLDYKTSDKADAPFTTHATQLRGDHPEFVRFTLTNNNGRETRYRWKGLQLPAYLCALRATAEGELASLPDDPVSAGFFLLPKNASETSVKLLEPPPRAGGDTDALVDAAEKCLLETAGRIADSQFWPPRDRVKYDAFKGLLFDRPRDLVSPPPAWSPPSQPSEEEVTCQ